MALLDIQTDFEVQTSEINLTPAAAVAVQELIEKKNLTGYGLRVYVGGGGCSGYQYGMALDDQLRPTDKEYTMHGVRLIVDEMSINYLRGATIDYVDELMGSGFQIENPNAVASCGCGHSFRTSEEKATTDSGSCC